MQFLFPLSSISAQDTLKVGNKAAHLAELSRLGHAVPAGFVISKELFKVWLENKCVLQEKTIQEEIFQAFDDLNSQHVAVRSSAIAEDSQNASWAGQLESILFVEKKDLLSAIEKCWQASMSEKVRAYGAAHSSDIIAEGMAVLVQLMLASDVSGVAFSEHPTNHNKEAIFIEASLGLGDAMVSGAVTPDSYVVNKNTLDVVFNLQMQERKQVFTADKGIVFQPVPKELQLLQKLPKDVIKQLAQMVIHLEIHFGYAVDVEWSWVQGKLWVLQCRPITNRSSPNKTLLSYSG